MAAEDEEKAISAEKSAHILVEAVSATRSYPSKF